MESMTDKYFNIDIKWGNQRNDVMKKKKGQFLMEIIVVCVLKINIHVIYKKNKNEFLND